MNLSNIRNFSIIAHIDHGKSTLADRMLDATGTVERRKMQEQVLDRMDLERERGITIKMQPVRMRYEHSGAEYELNLIDTPGHIDFAYEVSRALKAVEGVVLLVDSTQGVQAQTLSTLALAKEQGLVVIPVLSKVDAPLARVDEVKEELATLLGIEKSTVLESSGKTGEGVPGVLDAVVERIPPPEVTLTRNDCRALIFDFQYSDHRGVIVFVRVFDGTLKKGATLSFAAANSNFQALEVGIFTPDEKAVPELSAGEIGYIVTGIKEPGVASVGDTVINRGSNTQGLSGYMEPSPVIWASVFPESQDDFVPLRQALERLKLSDSSLSYEEESSGVMGRGFRCGFLGMLHLEIVTERLRREFNLELVVTTPSITYEIERKGKSEKIYSPAKFPSDSSVDAIYEPWVSVKLITPGEYVGSIVTLLYEHEGDVKDTETFPDGRTLLLVEMPLRELMRYFFDRLKSVSSGFASISYELIGMRKADVVKLEVLVSEEVVPAFSRIISSRRVETEGRELVERLHELLPRQMIVVKIQAQALGRIIASKKLPALRKDVTAKLYGGDVTRKRKLLEKQKKGKKKMQGMAKVDIPHDVFMKVMRGGEK